MGLEGLHPAVAEWFASRFDSPTPAQAKGWPAIRAGSDVLIAAPTGSGKTFAAFLWAIDSLHRRSAEGSLKDETSVVYVSPLRALSNDIERNLEEPLEAVREHARRAGTDAPRIRAEVRTGDTPPARRQRMAKKPPHILVTTPESLYILLTSDSGRRSLASVKSVIVDEIHALAGNKRGSHLALTLERLDHLVRDHGGPRPQRIGLSATQSPIDGIARFLAGVGEDGASRRCEIVDEGHVRDLDLAVEAPPSPLAAVMSGEVWEEVYDRIAELVSQHRTTLVFVATRRLSERVALNLGKRLGEAYVASHHGSIARDRRLRAEQRLKSGELKALVATASLELGIDIGHVDLVVQLGSPHRISAFLQRVGRSGHRLGATPKGRLFALTRDELVECAALVRAVRLGRLDRIELPSAPLDILAQQVVAMGSCEDWKEDELFQTVRRASSYASLPRDDFDRVIGMLSEGYVGNRGRQSSWLMRDPVGRRVKSRRGARIAAVTCGGAIPETADYDVLLEPQGTIVGTVNEDFAIESMPGDVFQLGNSSWRILRVEGGRLRVEDAKSAAPTIPFWLGEGPGRSAELSEEVSRLRAELEALAGAEGSAGKGEDILLRECGLSRSSAEQVLEYLSAGRAALGLVPTSNTIVLERFFDEGGGMQLVVHSPLGMRVNRAWGLSLRKKFCRTFNFELQAAASDDAIVLSLGPMHSFPLAEVASYVTTRNLDHTLEQALLPAPMFALRWRWNATRSLAVLRSRNGKKVPPPLQRMRSDDLLSLIFPEATACPENLSGEPQIPDHLLVRQTIADCMSEAMDLEGLRRMLGRIEAGEVEVVARDTAEPSPFAHEILNSKPYTFLDDAPLEERRVRAVQTRRSLDFATADDIGALDADAIDRVSREAWPQPQDEDEVHDSLKWMGFATEEEATQWSEWLGALEAGGRVSKKRLPGGEPLWVASERATLLESIGDDAGSATPRERATAELLRGRLGVLGPRTAGELSAPLGISPADAEQALMLLEAEGAVLRGRFRRSVASEGVDPSGPAAPPPQEWCERRLLARIHRATIDRLRKEIEPVPVSQFTRFLASWQHTSPDTRLDGPTGLLALVEQLQGFSAPLHVWEEHIFRARMVRYDPAWLDQLCLSGELVWLRHRGAPDDRPAAAANRSTPIAFLFRDSIEAWRRLSPAPEAPQDAQTSRVEESLARRGASFISDIVRDTGLLDTEVEEALARLVAASRATCDAVAGLRYLLAPEEEKRASTAAVPGARIALKGRARSAGRWALLPSPSDVGQTSVGRGEVLSEEEIEAVARHLLRRYGVIFRAVVARESPLPPWRDLLRACRRLEARGEVRGGRFVDGPQGEQFALPLAVAQLRGVKRSAPDGRVLLFVAQDPLNLAGLSGGGTRVPAAPGNALALADGIVVAVRIGGVVETAPGSEPDRAGEALRMLSSRAPAAPPPEPQVSLVKP
jgi:ATP-dependent Lhr-like helicase